MLSVPSKPAEHIVLVLQAMKINMKLGGVNWGFNKPLFPWVAKPFIAFGASVSHSGARQH